MKHQPSPPTPRQAARVALDDLDNGASLTASSPQELRDLRYDWGTAYIISAGVRWMAIRRDNGRMLIAGSPDELRDLIRQDYSQAPVPRDDDSK